MPLFYTKILFRMNGELSRSLICRIRPTSSLFSFMAEISPHQGAKSQWIEQLEMITESIGNYKEFQSADKESKPPYFFRL